MSSRSLFLLLLGCLACSPVSSALDNTTGLWQTVVRASDGLLLSPLDDVTADFPKPVSHFLLRFRGWRGNSFTLEYEDSKSNQGRYSSHTGTGGGSLATLASSRADTPSSGFDHQAFILFSDGKVKAWQRSSQIDTRAQLLKRPFSGSDIKKLHLKTWNPHALPYFFPAHIRQIEILLPTPEQLEELQQTRRTSDLLEIPGIAFPEDPQFDTFSLEFDSTCRYFAKGNFAKAAERADQMLADHSLADSDPYREVLTSISQCGSAITALKSNIDANGTTWPELADNPHYRLNPETGHAYLYLPILAARVHAERLAAAAGGHLATIGPPESVEAQTLYGWLAEQVPMPIALSHRTRKRNGYHLGADWGGKFRSRWSWQTLEPDHFDEQPWREASVRNYSTFSGHALLGWSLPPAEKDDPTKRIPKLDWQIITDQASAFPLIEFPSPATRYPVPMLNHPNARDAEPGPTGDPLQDFEISFIHNWQNEIIEPHNSAEQLLRERYAGALERQARTIAQTGELDTVLPWYNELQNTKEGAELIPHSEDTPAGLVELREIWNTEYDKLVALDQTRRSAAITQATDQLTTIAEAYTADDKKKRANAAQKRIKQLQKGEGLPEE